MALTMNIPLLISCKENTIIVDLQGKPLLSNNSYYYIKPPKPSLLGGLSIGEGSYIVENRLEIEKGIPVRFINRKLGVSNGAGVVNESTNLIIQFHISDDKQYQWNVVGMKDRLTRKYTLYVGDEGTKEVKDGWFQIMKSKNGQYSYNIMYCLIGKSCKPVGIFLFNNDRFLVLNDRPSDFVFQKA
ncbi:hypothetical protein ACFE04_002271 [Oxalis oulophora]